jgi:hypothetical protein
LGVLGAVLVAGLLAASACENTCPAETLVLTVSLAKDAVAGDDLLVEVFQDQTLLKRGFVARGDGHKGRIEIFLGPDYHAGKVLNVKVTSRSNAVPVGLGTASLALAESCSTLEIPIANTRGENWSCLNSIVLSDPPPEGDLPAGKTFRVLNLSEQPIQQTSAKACPASAPAEDCDDPVWVSTSSTGSFEFDLPNSFKGYIKLTAPGYLPAYLELVRFLGYVQTRPTVLMAKPEEMQAIAAMASAPAFKQDRGLLVLATTDCIGKRVGGIGFKFTGMDSTSPDDPKLFILVNNLSPSNSEQLKQTDANGDGYLVTDATGTAIMTNVPTGYFTLRPYNVKTGTWFNYINPRVRAGSLTYVAVEPN